MAHIRTDTQPVTQITVIEPELGKQAEASSLMIERAPLYGAPARVHLRQPASQPGRASHRQLHPMAASAISGRRLINHRNSARSGTNSIS
jgi:hypothetical protein